MANPVVHWEIAGKDADKLQEFYGTLFDWEINVQADMGGYSGYRLVEASEGGIGGGLMQTGEGMPDNYVIFYVQVDDLQTSLDNAVALGGQTVVPPTPIPGMGAFAIFTDPEGNSIGMFQG